LNSTEKLSVVARHVRRFEQVLFLVRLLLLYADLVKSFLVNERKKNFARTASTHEMISARRETNDPYRPCVARHENGEKRRKNARRPIVVSDCITRR